MSCHTVIGKPLSQLIESDEEFNTNMQQGYDDMKGGRVTPLKETFKEIKDSFKNLNTHNNEI